MRTPTVLFALTLAACSTPADEFRAILPDDRLEIDESSFSDLARGVGEPSEYYAMTRDATRDVNGGVREVLELVDEIASFPPTWQDDGATALWGPWLDGGFYGQMWVTHNTDGSWTWAIELRPEDSAEDAWEAVLAGEVDAGGDALHNTGRFTVDFTAIDTMGAGDGVTGAMAAEYELLEDGAVATVSFGEISEEGSLPADAAYHYEHTRGEGGLMDLVIVGDVSDPLDGTEETLVIRSRWDGEGAGRSDALVTGGEVGPLTYTESECWDASHAAVYFENNYEMAREGEESSCVFAEASMPE